jgi:hypothetical protein
MAIDLGNGQLVNAPSADDILPFKSIINLEKYVFYS